jgi:class 3 adenylate cyclase
MEMKKLAIFLWFALFVVIIVQPFLINPSKNPDIAPENRIQELIIESSNLEIEFYKVLLKRDSILSEFKSKFLNLSAQFENLGLDKKEQKEKLATFLEFLETSEKHNQQLEVYFSKKKELVDKKILKQNSLNETEFLIRKFEIYEQYPPKSLQNTFEKLKKLENPKSSEEIIILKNILNEIIDLQDSKVNLFQKILSYKTTTFSLNNHLKIDDSMNKPFSFYSLKYTILSSFISLSLYLLYLLYKYYRTVNLLKISSKELIQSYERFVPKESIELIPGKTTLNIQLNDCIKKDMTVLYCDIRSFTYFTESFSTEEKFDFINSYLKHMGPIVRKHNGFIDKYVGDAIIALFEGESENALKASIEMQIYLKEYNDKHIDPTHREPIEIGIGIHTGELLLGAVGENNRLDTAIISDSVNLASKIEYLTKFYGVNILITDGMLDIIEDLNKYKIRFIDKVRLREKSRAVKLYEVYDSDPIQLIEKKDLTNQMLKEAIDLFYNRDPETAKEILEACIRELPKDKTMLHHYQKCKLWIPRLKEPEEEWEDATEPIFK